MLVLAVAPVAQAYDIGTESDSRSPDGVLEYGNADMFGMSATEADEHLFWAHQQAKSRWRRPHTGEPLRSVRRLVKRIGMAKSRRKGHGKCKGHRHPFLPELPDEEIDEIYSARERRGPTPPVSAQATKGTRLGRMERP